MCLCLVFICATDKIVARLITNIIIQVFPVCDLNEILEQKNIITLLLAGINYFSSLIVHLLNCTSV